MQKDTYQKKSQEQRHYYNQTAKNYDQWHVETPSAKIVDAWNFANLKNFLGTRKIAKALELGSGTGRLANNLLAISQTVYGIDQSAEVLKIAQKKYPQLKLSCAEVVNLPYQDDYFDLVIINGSLHHFFAVEKTLAEAHRVLKKGGGLVLLGEPSNQFLKIYNPFFYFWLIDRIIFKIFSFLKIIKNPVEEIEPEAESYSPKNLQKKISEAGFEIKYFYTYDYFIRHNHSLFLKFYSKHLSLENKTLARIFPNLGQAIQVFSVKK